MKKPVHFLKLVIKNNNFKSEHFHLSTFKDCENLKTEFSLIGDTCFPFIRLKITFPSSWKEIVKQDSNIHNDLLTFYHQLLITGKCLSIDRLTSGELFVTKRQ